MLQEIGSRERSLSPTTSLWEGRRQARTKMAAMVNMGLHVFNPEWQTSAGAGGKPHNRMYSATFRDTTMKIYGTDETLTFPVQTCTKVGDLKEALANTLMVPRDDISIVVKQAMSSRKQLDNEEVARHSTVRGIKSFKPLPHKWPHPTVVIGTGYQGMKTAMLYVTAGNTDIQLFDRHSQVGGNCWIDAANKTSKIQTEFGSFHVWNMEDLRGKGLSYPMEETRRWGIWPKKAEILEHFQYAAEKYGILPYCVFNTNVAKLDIEGDKNAEDRAYKLTVTHVDNADDKKEVMASCMFSYPGSMTRNRLIEYPGEDIFDGQIGYGMGDDTPYEMLKDSCSAVLGNGAFAVENIRTCCEYQAEKVYLLTRRKNLACPRVPCWFCHQGPVPTPAAMLLRMFEPMYKLAGFGDPFEFWSVHASQDRSKVTIMQNSRFGIGDVTFLAIAYGKAEFIQDTLKRLTKNTMHLTGGRKLENVNNIIKSLGLLGDYAADRLHRMKQMVGVFCDGDWRRVLSMDAPGMNAANFTTFSVLGSGAFARTFKFLYEYPKEFYKMVGMGLMQQLPTNKADEKQDRPAHIYDVKYAMSAGITLESMCPKLQELSARDAEYKHKMYHAAHSTTYFLEECEKSWNEYQKTWQEWGSTQSWIPFPYTREIVDGFYKEYSELVGLPISSDGPPIESSELVPLKPKGDEKKPGIGSPPPWAEDDKTINTVIEQAVNGGHKEWWKEQGSRW